LLVFTHCRSPGRYGSRSRFPTTPDDATGVACDLRIAVHQYRQRVTIYTIGVRFAFVLMGAALVFTAAADGHDEQAFVTRGTSVRPIEGGSPFTVSFALPGRWTRTPSETLLSDPWHDPRHTGGAPTFDASGQSLGIDSYDFVGWSVDLVAYPAWATVSHFRRDALATERDTTPADRNFGLIGDMFVLLPVGPGWRATWIDHQILRGDPYDRVMRFPDPIIRREFWIDRGVLKGRGKATSHRLILFVRNWCARSLCSSHNATLAKINQSLRIKPSTQ
jgi:hypothetical protein